ncbi:Mlp family lipoprotein [Borreliella afzelii]|uniref:Signal recognition particle GTPase n=1 Tax=Borreliella afzelii TaxID=29518 RepID=A0AB34Z3I5_BORAF|nr:signal recognition particle GTPase [Borreliella afzelii]
MKIINILFCLFLIMLNGCNSNNNETLNKNNMQQEKSRKKRDLDTQEPQEEKEKITLTSEEEKKFNSLTNAFKYTIEKLSDQINGYNDGNKNKCNDFFDWLSKDIQKQKELVSAFKKVYDFLASKANNEDFDAYVQGAIDCKVAKDNNKCNNHNNNHHNNKYGSGDGTNEVEQYFRGVAGDMYSKNSNEEIYQYLKEELLKTDNHYDGLTSNWKD